MVSNPVFSLNVCVHLFVNLNQLKQIAHGTVVNTRRVQERRFSTTESTVNTVGNNWSNCHVMAC